MPPLEAALAYEAVFGMPVSILFLNAHASVKEAIERKLEEMEGNLVQRDAKDRGAHVIAQKLAWLKERKTR